VAARPGRRPEQTGRGPDAAGGPPVPTFSIVIETDNLHLTDLAALRDCLDSFARQGPTLTRAKGVFLIDGGELADETFAELQRDYAWLTVVRVEPKTSYVGLKARGASLSDSDLIIFCDADLRYEASWLDALLAGFAERPDAQIVAGETTTPIRGPYSLAFALTFNFPRYTGETRLAPSSTYWANNVAMRRALVETMPIPDPAVLYRGQNIVHSLALVKNGVTIWRQPRARAQHIVIAPWAIRERFLTLGRDAVSVARLTRGGSGRAYLAAMAPDRSGGNPLRKIAGRLRQVVRENPLHVALLPLAAPIVGVFGIWYLTGKVSRTLGRDPQPERG
jgi:hypothetical protein